MLSYLREHEVVSRAEVLRRFRRDDDATVRGVLRDLVNSGLVFKSGRGDGTVYRAASVDELGSTDEADPREAAASLVWVAVHRHGPISVEALNEIVRLGDEALTESLELLISDGRVTQEGDHYTSDDCVIPLGATVGWEGAVLDHYQAMVGALLTKLSQGTPRALPDDAVGGSTYHFDIDNDHPLHEDVVGFLREVRQRASDLRQRVDDTNAERRLNENNIDACFVLCRPERTHR